MILWGGKKKTEKKRERNAVPVISPADCLPFFPELAPELESWLIKLKIKLWK